MRLIVLRHGATVWNAEKRLQGRADPPLSAAGREQVEGWRLRPEWRRLACLVSPLRRARETAALLGFAAPIVAPELIEMDWGSFEGERVADLRRRLGPAMAAMEALGLDFRPPGGESPREVMARLRLWLEALAEEDAVLVTHKGVRRAFLALATGWDMLGDSTPKLRDHEAMVLEWRPKDGLSLIELAPVETRP